LEGSKLYIWFTRWHNDRFLWASWRKMQFDMEDLVLTSSVIVWQLTGEVPGEKIYKLVESEIIRYRSHWVRFWWPREFKTGAALSEIECWVNAEPVHRASFLTKKK
jgi:hypothetical protein